MDPDLALEDAVFRAAAVGEAGLNGYVSQSLRLFLYYMLSLARFCTENLLANGAAYDDRFRVAQATVCAVLLACEVFTLLRQGNARQFFFRPRDGRNTLKHLQVLFALLTVVLLGLFAAMWYKGEDHAPQEMFSDILGFLYLSAAWGRNRVAFEDPVHNVRHSVLLFALFLQHVVCSFVTLVTHARFLAGNQHSVLTFLADNLEYVFLLYLAYLVFRVVHAVKKFARVVLENAIAVQGDEGDDAAFASFLWRLLAEAVLGLCFFVSQTATSLVIVIMDGPILSYQIQAAVNCVLFFAQLVLLLQSRCVQFGKNLWAAMLPWAALIVVMLAMDDETSRYQMLSLHFGYSYLFLLLCVRDMTAHIALDDGVALIRPRMWLSSFLFGLHLVFFAVLFSANTIKETQSDFSNQPLKYVFLLIENVLLTFLLWVSYSAVRDSNALLRQRLGYP
jgi:hypothetical protein